MINVILADHERIFRIGMASALSTEDDIRIVGQPSNQGQLIAGLEKFRPHVLLVSSAFLGCLDAIRQSCERQHTGMLLLQDYGTESTALVFADFQGVIRRSADQKSVVECIRHLAHGGKVIRLTRTASAQQTSDDIGDRVRDRLTEQELAIVSYVVRGYKNREIALRLGTNEQTVKNSLRNIFDKTGVFGRLELALFVVHHRTLAAASGATVEGLNLKSVTELQRQWDSNRRLFIH
jgi:DNA-binding NarL/FixJ family response regulator